MKWTLGPIGSCLLLVAGDGAAIRATGPHDAADCPSGALSNQCWGGRCSRVLWWGREQTVSTPTSGHPPPSGTGCAQVGHRQAHCGWSGRGICLCSSASSKEQVAVGLCGRSVTVCCANQPRHADTHRPLWASSHPGNQHWGLSVPLLGQERGQSSDTRLSPRAQGRSWVLAVS